MEKLTIRAAVLSLLSVLLLFVIASEIWSETPLYVDTSNKDFNADAPWRVQDAGTPIPFSFLIKDVWKNDLAELHFLQIDMVSYPGGQKTRIYKRWFYNLQINENTTGSINGNWEWHTKHFLLAENGLTGEITAQKLGYGSSDDIYFVATIDSEDDLSSKTFFEKYLNSNFISGHVNLAIEPNYSLPSRLARMDVNTFAYAAHPLDELDPFIIGTTATMRGRRWSSGRYLN